jgi:hypothetical protein
MTALSTATETRSAHSRSRSRTLTWTTFAAVSTRRAWPATFAGDGWERGVPVSYLRRIAGLLANDVRLARPGGVASRRSPSS